ncbi:MAG: hypothetical protein CL760_05915 [Chloroflexi bacterium]|nr:hypothetical protein [Chloroflexota bacterium]|tara:strand:+ start:303 stop:1202 length:900 start_codon:yes stop_codon:yes gene_type:complete
MHDLNLLKVFDTMMQTQSVSKTAEVLNKTPSAISQSLNKLRAEFNEEALFVKEDRSLKPTQYAIDLHKHIKESLDLLNDSNKIHSKFDPKTSKRTFKIGSHSIFDNLFFIKLRNKVKSVAPNVKIELTNLSFQEDLHENALRLRHIDAMIGLNTLSSLTFNSKKIAEYDIKVICSKNHPRLKESLTIEQYLQEEHAVWINQESSKNTIMFKIDGERKIVYTSNSLFNVIHNVSQSDIVSLFSEKLLKHFNLIDSVKVLEPPFKTRDIPLNLTWHKRIDKDKGFIWLRGIIEEIFKELEE